MDEKCIECNNDVSYLISWQTLFDEFIECVNCGCKMDIEYDESFEGGNETQYWSVVAHVEEV